MSEYFTGNPIKLDVSRSKYHVSPRWTGSWKVGELVPIFATCLVMPGDTFKMRISSAVRTITPIVPVMDDMDMTIECFFVPHHLIMSREYMSPSVNDSNRSWAAFIGAQDAILNMPLPSNNIELPFINVDEGEYTVGGLCDCLGFPPPTGSGNVYVTNFLKVAAYYSIWNEYWRDPNTMSPVTYAIDGSGYAEFTGANVGADPNYATSYFPCAPTCRYHGYFGSALPWPQRNSTAVTLPLGAVAPVKIGDTVYQSTGKELKYHLDAPVTTSNPVLGFLGDQFNNGQNNGTYQLITPNDMSGYTGSGANVDGLNLYADLSVATAATINQVRLMFQTQRWYEQLARSGNREGEITYGMFGVRGNDEGLRRPEYLGGKRIPISQTQVPSTGNGTTSSSTTASLGTNGAFSLTNDSDYYFTKSFTTWGTLMVVLTCRTRESFAQGCDRENFKFDRFDFYWPQFANIGEQAVLNKEIRITGTPANDDAPFGYQEAWAEYRMFNDHVTGLVRPGQSLGMMTYANAWSNPVTLAGYLFADQQYHNVDRTLQVAQSTAGYTFYGQFQFDIDMVRPMPLYSIPGLVDHH